MRVLAVDVDQPLAHVGELLHGGGGAVHERARAAAPLHDPAEQQPAGVALERGVREPLLHAGEPLDRELGGHLGALGAGADHRGVGALPERERERVDQDRLPGAGLAGERGEAGLELEVEPVDDGEIPDREGDEHVAVCRVLALRREGRHPLALPKVRKTSAFDTGFFPYSALSVQWSFSRSML